MKTTIELPDDLYRQVKARAALEGRTVREVTQELYRLWLSREPGVTESLTPPKDWARRWFDLADEVMKRAPAGPPARQHLEEDRRRLDRE